MLLPIVKAARLKQGVVLAWLAMIREQENTCDKADTHKKSRGPREMGVYKEWFRHQRGKPLCEDYILSTPRFPIIKQSSLVRSQRRFSSLGRAPD